MVGEAMPGECIVEITRLIDMPVAEKMFGGGLKQYRVKAFDGSGAFLDQTEELAGFPENPNVDPEELDVETLRLGAQGILRFSTPDPVIFLHVEYAGGLAGNHRIGRCRIHRADMRSKQVWPYTLSNRDGEPVGCGIELKVVDGGPPVPPPMPPPMGSMPPMGMPPMGMPPPMASMPPMGPPPPPMGSVGPSFHTMPPQEFANMAKPPGSMRAGTPPPPPTGTMQNGPPGTVAMPSFRTQAPEDLERLAPPSGVGTPPTAGFQTMSPQEMQRMQGSQAAQPSFQTMAPMSPQEANIPVVAYLELDRVTDLVAFTGAGAFPKPKGSKDGDQVVVTLEPAAADGGSGRLDVGKKELDRSGPFQSEMQGQLLKANLAPANLRIKVPFGELAKGSTDLRVIVWVQQDKNNLVPVGATKTLTVSWKPEPPKHYAIIGSGEKNCGGIYLSHRFARETDVPQPIKKATTEIDVRPERPLAADKSAFQSHSRHGNFPKGSDEDFKEHAAGALEAQNRALLQRLKEADPDEHGQMMSDREWVGPSGYRDWKDLDSLFITMGPNYVAQSDSVGSHICRVYQEDSTLMRELEQEKGPTALGRPVNLEDKATKLQLVEMMTKEHPERVQSALRPVIAKDAKQLRLDQEQAALKGIKREKPKLHVKVIAANYLHNPDDLAFGTTGVKVVVEIPGKRARWETSSINNVVNPVWEEEGELEDYWYGDDVVLKVVDKNFVVFTEHMGEVRLKAEEFEHEPFTGTVHLKGGKQTQAGQLPTLSFEVHVAAHGNLMNWPPEPPVYAPIANLNPSDQETQRLANYDPIQCAKLPFADVNPNYCINQDIWGALGDAKAANALLMQKPDHWKIKRVKDDCIMA